MEIDANIRNIESLAEVFYEVPDYQREYVWDSEEHVQRFLDDIYDEFDPASDETAKYFIGSIIIVKNERGIFDVVDGQQRLTTIILCLCAVREILYGLEVEDKANSRKKEGLTRNIQDILLYYSTDENIDRPRLRLQYEDSKDFLDQLIINKKVMEEQPTKSIEKMYQAYQTIFQYFETLERQSVGDFLDFIRYFLSKVELVVIEPDSISSALKIFETINERGVGLDAMDLLKNLLFANASKRDFKVIKDVWKKMMTHIEKAGKSAKPLRFLRYFLMARYHNGVIREDRLYKWLTSSNGKHSVGYEDDPVSFVKELEKYAQKYKRYIKATESRDTDSGFPNLTGIGHLLRRRSRQHLVLLMALKSSFDKKTVNKLANALEVLAFYYALNRVLTKQYERQFANWAAMIRSYNSSDEVDKFIETELAGQIDKQRRRFDSAFTTKTQGDILPQYRIKYILGKVDAFIKKKSNLSINSIKHYQKLEIEHILPQTPRNFPKNEYEDEFIYQNWVNRIGNLTLIESPINQALNKANDISNNEWFEKKKKEYKNSTVELTKTIVGNNRIGSDTSYNKFIENNLKSFDTWGTKAIEERQEMLNELMMKIWKL